MPGPDAYVPGHTHDVFLSYAWVDNTLPGLRDPAEGWVHALADNLRALLAQQLGRADWGDVWLDRRLDRAQSITPEVETAVRDSALLLVVLSEGYLESPWCQHELAQFIDRHGGPAGVAGRIFLVHRTAISPERRPEPLRDLLGYTFFTSRNGHDMPLGFPFADYRSPQDRDYFIRLDDLSLDLARRLRSLREQAGAAPARAPTPATLPARPDPKSATGPGPASIFLAEVTPDLRSWRDRLERQLEQSGFGVRPEMVYPAAPSDYRDAVLADLAQSLLFVQVLGPYTSAKRPDMRQGYEGLQLELAQQAGVPILRWCDPDLDRTKVDDPDLFGRAELIVTGFDDFKRQVETAARRLLLPTPKPVAGETQVLIRAAASDEATACRLGDALYDRHSIGYELADEHDALSDLVTAYHYQGLVVIYEQCDRHWAKRQVQECRVIAMEGKGKAPACAVLDPPKPDKPRLGIRVPRFHFLTGLDDPEMGEFVSALSAAA